MPNIERTMQIVLHSHEIIRWKLISQNNNKKIQKYFFFYQKKPI